MAKLPILQSPPAVTSTTESLLRMFHRTQLRWTEHFAEPAQLDVGTAFANPELPRVFEANQMFDVAIPEDLSAADAVAEVDRYYARVGTQCWAWSMNAAAPPERTGPLLELLAARGFRPRAFDVMYLRQLPALAINERPDLTIIPARASYRHAREISEEAASRWNEPQLVEAWMAHLDDPHWDCLIALKDGRGIAMAGVLAVGEIGRIDFVHVVAAHRRLGIGQLMVSRVLEICARSLFKHVFLSVMPDNEAAIALYGQMGFRKIGQGVSHVHPHLK